MRREVMRGPHTHVRTKVEREGVGVSGRRGRKGGVTRVRGKGGREDNLHTGGGGGGAACAHRDGAVRVREGEGEGGLKSLHHRILSTAQHDGPKPGAPQLAPACAGSHLLTHVMER